MNGGTGIRGGANERLENAIGVGALAACSLVCQRNGQR